MGQNDTDGVRSRASPRSGPVQPRQDLAGLRGVADAKALPTVYELRGGSHACGRAPRFPLTRPCMRVGIPRLAHSVRWLTRTLTGRGERMRASGPVEREVRHPPLRHEHLLEISTARGPHRR